MASKKGTAVSEPSAYVEIGGYAHLNGGQVKTNLYVSDVNKPLEIEDAEITKRLKKLRVTMNVEEDKSVSENCVYSKNVTMVQEPSNGDSAPTGTQRTGDDWKPQADGKDGGPNPLQVLKNFVDNIAADNRWQWVLIVAACIIGATALAVALIR